MESRLIILLLLAGCTATPRGDGLTDASVGATPSETGDSNGNTTGGVGDDGGTVGDTGSPTGTAGDDADGGTGLLLDVGAEPTGGQGEIAEVFGHSDDTLYRVDPTTKAVEEVGTFDGCDTIIDIALDANSQMYGTSYESLYAIDRTTGACTFIADGEYPTSLSFVPAGTVDPDNEAMVGFVEEQYIRIDVATGAVTPLGTLTDGLVSSGDLVSVNGGGSWLTVEGPGCANSDCIIEIDPSTGAVLKNYGTMPFDQVFGLAFWAGRAYGFSRSGVLFEIEFGEDAVMTTPIQIPGAPFDLEFFGAGSTTSAPPAEG